jgi:hypothetical protein
MQNVVQGKAVFAKITSRKQAIIFFINGLKSNDIGFLTSYQYDDWSSVIANAIVLFVFRNQKRGLHALNL